MDARLGSLKLGERAMRQADCPSDEDLRSLAAGILPCEQAERYMLHAANCDHCGPALKDLAEDFADELSSEEQSTLLSLRSSRTDWQRPLAERLSVVATAHPVPIQPATSFWSSLFRPRFALQAVGVAASVTAIWIALAILRTESPDRLLAQAYTDHRTLETRLAGAKYAPVRVERGVAGSSIDKSPYLLRAEALISENLQRHPDDPVWLSAKGRVDLLEGDSDEAISTLTRSLGRDPHSVQARIDLASAYFQRAQRPGRAGDYGTAVDGLSQVLKQHPNELTALFNRAIVYEKLFLYDEAVRDWQRYLQLDSKGAWAAEARSRADAVRQKMKSRDSFFHSTTPDPLGALAFLIPLRSVEPASLKPPAEAMEENFISEATTHWLPTLGLERTAKGGASTHGESDVLTILASLMVEHHHDAWLRDLLIASPSPGFAKGMQSLAGAIQANQENDSEQVRKSALEAASYFRRVNNKAGELRARFELLYALKRAQKGPDCLAHANKLSADLAGRSYSWLEVQTLLEQSNCMYMIGEFEAARRASNTALVEAESARYPTLYLRSLGFAAGLATNNGDTASSWQLDLKGLALYWSGPFDSLRAWQFYSDMGFAAEESSEWSLAVALARESVFSARATGRLGEEARARLRLATVASADEQFDEAAEEFRSANQIFRRLPQTASIKAFEADGAISLAEMEIERNQLSDALSVLNETRSILPQLESYSILLRYYKTLGRLQYLRGDDRRADSSLSTALYVSDLGARSFSANDDRDLLTWQRETRDLYRYLVELQLFLRKDPWSALQVWERYRAVPLRQALIWQRTHGSGSRHLPYSPLSVEALAHVPSFSTLKGLKEFSLPATSESVLISYAWLTKGLAMWVADHAGVHTEWIPVEKEAFDQIAKRFLSACADPRSGSASIRSDGQQLFGWLIAPVERYLHSAQQIVVETDDSVSLIPFQALSDSSGQYIGSRWTFLYSPGVAYRRISHPSSVSFQNSRVVAVGISAVGGELGQGLLPIPDAALEAQEIAELFNKRTLLLDSSANPVSVRDALAGAEVFHFSGHSLVWSHQQGLLLAPDPLIVTNFAQSSAFFGTNEIRKLNLQKCQLIVLSACATASSQELFLSPEDLVGAFLRVGARTVVASRWRVDSRTTRKFMSTFYEGLFATASVASALQLAASTLCKDVTTSHPFYWAAFSGYGADLK